MTKPGEMFPREKSGDKSGRSKHDPRGEQYRSLQPERAEFKPETQHGEHSVKKPSSNIGITSTKSDIKDGYEPVVSTKIQWSKNSAKAMHSCKVIQVIY